MVSNKDIESFKYAYGFEFIDNWFLKDLIENDDKLNHEIDYWGIDETETRSLLMNKISETLIQKRYPTYGDNVDIDEFFLSMKKSYEDLKNQKDLNSTLEKDIESFKQMHGLEFIDNWFLKNLIENDDELTHEINYYGMKDILTFSRLMNKITLTLLQTKYPAYPTYPTFGENVDINEFFTLLKQRYDDLKNSKTFSNFGSDWVEQKDSNSALDWMTQSNTNWVYDLKNNVFLMFPMGFHINAIFYLLRNFYGFNRIREDDITLVQDVMDKNFVIFGSSMNGLDGFLYHLLDYDINTI